MVALKFVAEHLGCFANRCFKMGKILHVLCTGCNTVNLALPLKAAIEEAAWPTVWFMGTRDVWPGDLACLP